MQFFFEFLWEYEELPKKKWKMGFFIGSKKNESKQ